ncbi:MAG: ATP-binding protein [Caldiserica bacterium]|jgi:PAS domain S-box-containing protein|nr:ATP-binding protein [Caldisericota bacterium]MDH7562068.1 ATP-binding protein [Caldisericota bacterium]
MKIGQKVLISFFIIGGIPLIALGILAYLFSTQILLKTEAQHLISSLSAVESFIDLQKTELQMTAEDYGLWTDHYQAILEGNSSWIEENITSWIPKQFDIELLILFDRSGNVLGSSGSRELFNSKILELARSKALGNSEFFSGTERLGKSLAIFSSGPILQNDGKGPPEGALILVKSIAPQDLSLFEGPGSFPVIQTSELLVNPKFRDIPQLSQIKGLEEKMASEDDYQVLSGGAIFARKPILNPQGEVIANLGYFSLAQEVNQARRNTIIFSLIIGFGFLALSFIASGFLQRWLLSPLNLLLIDAKKLLSGREISSREFPNDLVGAIASSMMELYRESRDARQKAEAESTWFQGILDSSQDAILVFDSQGKLADANKAAEDFFSQSKASFLGLNPEEALKKAKIDPQTLTPRFWEGFKEAIQSGKRSEYEGNFAALDKRVLVTIFPLIIDREIKGVILNLKDITSMRKLESERRTLLEGVAHDLGSPITTLMAAVELLKGCDPSQASSYLRGMENNLLLIKNLVQNLVNLNRLEAGMLKPEFTKIDLPSFFERVRTMFLPLIQSRRLNFALDCPQDLPPVKADPTRLEEVFSNLLSNSCKNTPPDGLIFISARRADSSVKILFSDTGYGIPPEEMQFVFQRFQQGRSGRRAGGSGLGLFITKSLVELMGGTISLKSEKGKGTTVEVSLPLFQEEITN